MRTLILAGLGILLAVSIGSTYYTYSMEQDERERGQSLSEEVLSLENQVTEVESLIGQTDEKKAETESLILVERARQEEIQGEIDIQNTEKSELQEKVDLYRKIAEKDPRVLITVDDPVVKAKVAEVTRLCKTTEEKQQAIFEYVRKEIEYTTEGNPLKWDYPQPHLEFKYDFWQLPRETIEWRKGDCEDVSILLCTMMRTAGVSSSNVRVVLGTVNFGGGTTGHAWCEFKMKGEWYVLESTCPTCNYFEKSVYYSLFLADVSGWFNDYEYEEEESAGTDEEAGACVVVDYV
jgi:transglutaminase-like putative cysteine protease